MALDEGYYGKPAPGAAVAGVYRKPRGATGPRGRGRVYDKPPLTAALERLLVGDRPEYRPLDARGMPWGGMTSPAGAQGLRDMLTMRQEGLQEGRYQGAFHQPGAGPMMMPARGPAMPAPTFQTGAMGNRLGPFAPPIRPIGRGGAPSSAYLEGNANLLDAILSEILLPIQQRRVQ